MEPIKEQRGGEGRRRDDRRKAQDPDFKGPERRSGDDRRNGGDRRSA